MHQPWQKLNAMLYLTGGIGFLIGSIFFYPHFEDQFPTAGAWIFFAASLLYLVVTVHDLIESRQYFNQNKSVKSYKKLESFSVLVYTLGTLLFAIGSLFFLPSLKLATTGAWCFIIGSILFVIGACLNVMQIIYTNSKITMQLLNAVAISFIVGAIGFIIASVPYLWQSSTINEDLIYSYTATTFLISSLCFVTGGIFNFKRLELVSNHSDDQSTT